MNQRFLKLYYISLLLSHTITKKSFFCENKVFVVFFVKNECKEVYNEL